MVDVAAPPLWIGKELRVLRAMANARAVDVAQRVGISPELLSHIENGRRSVSLDRATRIVIASLSATSGEAGPDAGVPA